MIINMTTIAASAAKTTSASSRHRSANVLLEGLGPGLRYAV